MKGEQYINYSTWDKGYFTMTDKHTGKLVKVRIKPGTKKPNFKAGINIDSVFEDENGNFYYGYIPKGKVSLNREWTDKEVGINKINEKVAKKQITTQQAEDEYDAYNAAHPTELKDVEVIADSPHKGEPDPTAPRTGIDIYAGQAAPSQAYMDAYNKIGFNPIFNDVRVRNYQNALARNPMFAHQWDMANNINEFINVGTGGLWNRLSPTQNIRYIYDTFKNGWQNPLDYNSSWWGNNGIVTDEFAAEHPYLTMGINGGADLLVGRYGTPGGRGRFVSDVGNTTKRFLYNDAVINTSLKLPPVKRAVEVAARATDGAADGYKGVIHNFTTRGSYSNLSPALQYIIFGKNNTVRRLFGAKSYDPTDRFLLKNSGYRGLRSKSLKESMQNIGNDVFDAYFYGKELDPQLGRLASDQSDLGIFTDYVKENYPGRKVQVYEFGDDVNGPSDLTDVHKVVPGENGVDPTSTRVSESPMTGGEGNVPFTIDNNSSLQIDVGGHHEYTGYSPSNNKSYSQFYDIWKYNPNEYVKKWGWYLPASYDDVPTWQQIGLKWLDKAGNPIIFKQNWIPYESMYETPYFLF